MHNAMLTLLEKDGAVLKHKVTVRHARQARYDPPTDCTKATPCGQPRTVLLGVGAGCTPGIGAACVTLLTEAGHRIVSLPTDESLPVSTSSDIAGGRVVILPGPAADAADIRGAIKSLPLSLRRVDAVVSIIHPLPKRTSLLGDDTPCSDADPAARAGKLLDITRAALPGLLASGRGHVIAVALNTHRNNTVADYGHADALCAALHGELDDLGIRFTRISAGPVQGRVDAGPDTGNRPRSNGMQRGVLAAADVAQAIAWTLAQPDHVAVRDIAVGCAPRGQPALSPREREVLEWTACGKTSEEISCILELSVSAVNFHVKNLLFKLDCCNKTAAVARAALLGLLI
jgi:DNA-binding CsgD family transcriptional regulator